MDDREFWNKTDFSYAVSGDDHEIELQVYIDAECDRDRTLIASFQVDSMEMIESARIPLTAGKNHVPFQQTVRIVKPLLWQPRGSSGQPSFYHFSVIFHRHGTPCHTIDKRAGICFLDSCSKGNFFRINGETLPLMACEPDFALDEKDLADVLTGNLVRLMDTDPELEMKLERCCASGLIAALELSGKIGLRELSAKTGICFFTAGPDSPGERLYHREKQSALFPFFTHDELDLWLKHS